MMLTGSEVDGQTDLTIGLAVACFPTETFEGELEETCRRIVRLSWHTQRGVKRLLRETADMSLEAGLTYESANGPGRGLDHVQRITAGFP